MSAHVVKAFRPVVLLTGIAAASAAPNVLIFLVDDLGYGDLGFTGHPPRARRGSTRSRARAGGCARGARLSRVLGLAHRAAHRPAAAARRDGRRAQLALEQWPAARRAHARDELRESPAADATLALGKWHQGQTKPYLPAARRFRRVPPGLRTRSTTARASASPCRPSAAALAADVAAAANPPRGLGLGPQRRCR